jgi:hypothetical protein
MNSAKSAGSVCAVESRAQLPSGVCKLKHAAGNTNTHTQVSVLE